MTSTSLKDGWNTWGQYRDHDAMDESSAEPHPALDHDSELNQGRDSRRSSLDSRVQGPIKPHAAQSSDHDSELHQGRDSRRDSLDSRVQGPIKPHAAQSSDHDSELHQGRDSRRDSLDSQIQGPVNDMFRPSGMPNGMKRKSMCETFTKLY